MYTEASVISSNLFTVFVLVVFGSWVGGGLVISLLKSQPQENGRIKTIITIMTVAIVSVLATYVGMNLLEM